MSDKCRVGRTFCCWKCFIKMLIHHRIMLWIVGCVFAEGCFGEKPEKAQNTFRNLKGFSHYGLNQDHKYVAHKVISDCGHKNEVNGLIGFYVLTSEEVVVDKSHVNSIRQQHGWLWLPTMTSLSGKHQTFNQIESMITLEFVSIFIFSRNAFASTSWKNMTMTWKFRDGFFTKNFFL